LVRWQSRELDPKIASKFLNILPIFEQIRKDHGDDDTDIEKLQAKLASAS